MKDEKEYIQGELFKRISIRLPGVDPRLVSGYTVCIYFAEKVNAECVMVKVFHLSFVVG